MSWIDLVIFFYVLHLCLIFFELIRCNGRTWFNDSTAVFRPVLFYIFLFILFLQALLMLVVVGSAVALVLLGTILRTYLSY
ncbi:hypothetical protein HanIR_Chr15g0737061 [Helianthus annuus]|nr:hypothetical protein HanIR_Chr15g0737061 [Helianthus annuus]